MKLLIIGAGGHGHVIAEIADDSGYERIAFLDDNYQGAIGKIADIEKFSTEYEFAFVGIGNNEYRSELIDQLIHCGYTIPTLIHPTAYVSKTATIGRGTVIAPMAIINANAKVGEGCIISAAAIVDHNAVIGDFAHIDAGAIVKSGGSVPSLQKINAGQVVAGF